MRSRNICLLTIYIGDFVPCDTGFADDFHGMFIEFGIAFWPFEHCLHDLSIEDLDEAVGVGMGVNSRSLTFRPAQDDHVVLPVSTVNKVPRIPKRKDTNYPVQNQLTYI